MNPSSRTAGVMCAYGVKRRVGARRDTLLTEALAPLEGELSAAEIDRLKNAVAMLLGIEPMIVLRDVMRLDHDEARELGEWAVRQLVRSARERSDRARA
jgi:uncharacterized protein with von Willebrand factor type A (vWA) domain